MGNWIRETNYYSKDLRIFLKKIKHFSMTGENINNNYLNEIFHMYLKKNC